MRRLLPGVLAVLCAIAGAACKEEGSITVHSLKFVGVKSIDHSNLRAALATRASSKLPWGKKAYFDRARFDTDRKRIEAFYADRGYPDARVTGLDVRLNKKQDAVDITVTISEGTPIKVASVNFTGFDVIPPAHLEKLKKDTPLKVGQPRDRQLVLTTHEMGVNELRDHGYPYGQVAINEDDGPDGKTATVEFQAQPGEIAYFGPIEISGNKTVSENVIRRYLAYKPGELFQRSLIQSTQRRLYRVQLFQFATVEPLNQAQQPTEVPTRVTVAEGKHHRVNLGVGYGTEEKERVDAEYHEVNFLGGARSAGAHVRWSSLDRGVRLDFTQPYLFRPHYSLGVVAQQWYTFTPAYSSATSGGKVSLNWRSGRNFSWAVSMTNEHDRSAISDLALNNLALRNGLIALGLDPRTNSQSGTLNALGFDIQHSTADNVLNAHHGYQIAFHAEEAGKVVGGTFNYYGISADARHYLPLSSSLVLATRLQFGNIAPAGGMDKNIPFSKKYFLGGSTSIRGWGVYEVSPLSGGEPVGGDSTLAFTAELRAVLHGNLGGVLFLDGGNVWANSWGVRLNDLRYAVGPGLRYQTPIGPVRFDFGYQLNPIPGLLVHGEPQTRQWRVHFSIGQAF